MCIFSVPCPIGGLQVRSASLRRPVPRPAQQHAAGWQRSRHMRLSGATHTAEGALLLRRRMPVRSRGLPHAPCAGLRSHGNTCGSQWPARKTCTSVPACASAQGASERACAVRERRARRSPAASTACASAAVQRAARGRAGLRDGVHPDTGGQTGRQGSSAPRAAAQGSATVCILMLEGGRLHAANLGDSGFWVLRGRTVVHRSPQQQHAFNWPFQLGSPGSRSDTPSSAEARPRPAPPPLARRAPCAARCPGRPWAPSRSATLCQWKRARQQATPPCVCVGSRRPQLVQAPGDARAVCGAWRREGCPAAPRTALPHGATRRGSR